MNVDMLIVGGHPIKAEDMHKYSLRWCTENHEARPVLYLQGKRIVSAWGIVMNSSQPADLYGENANTA